MDVKECVRDSLLEITRGMREANDIYKKEHESMPFLVDLREGAPGNNSVMLPG